MANTLGVEPSQEFAKAVMTAFENQDDSQGLLTLFSKTKDKFMNGTGLFREGGKMNAFVEKFKCGGKKKVKKAALGDQIGGKISKAEDGTKVGAATYQIKKGDSLIKIARQFGLNSLDEILELNPQIKNPNLIHEGQLLNLPKDKMKHNGKVEAASVSDKMPNYDRVDYAKLPASVKTKVDAYAQAIRDHKMKASDVPALYRQQAYNQSIRSATNEAAPMVATKALMAPWTIPDTVIRGGLNEARKAINGKDDTGDYGTGDYFDGNFS
jgi:LysM repeat protein